MKPHSFTMLKARALDPICTASTLGLYLKGRGVEQEIEDARKFWQFEHRLIPSLTQAGAAVVEVRNLVALDKGA